MMSADDSIFNQKYQEFSTPVYHYAFKLCRDWQIAEDISQVTWVKLYRFHTKHRSFPETKNIFRMTYQSFVDDYRKRKKQSHVTCFEELPDSAPESSMLPTREDRLAEADELALFHAFWEQFYELGLSMVDKEIFWLKERYGYTMNEVAAKTGMARSTAHDKLKKIKQACLEFINAQAEKSEPDSPEENDEATAPT